MIQFVMFLLMAIAAALACAIGWALGEYVVAWWRRRE